MTWNENIASPLGTAPEAESEVGSAQTPPHESPCGLGDPEALVLQMSFLVLEKVTLIQGSGFLGGPRSAGPVFKFLMAQITSLLLARPPHPSPGVLPGLENTFLSLGLRD